MSEMFSVCKFTIARYDVLSDCAIVDSEEEEDKRSHLESIDDDSDEEFVPYKLSSEEEEDSASDLEEFIPRTRPKNAKNEKSWKKKVNILIYYTILEPILSSVITSVLDTVLKPSLAVLSIC